MANLIQATSCHSPTHAALPDTIMLDVNLPATHTQGVIPASIPAMPIETDMIDTSAPVLTPDTALVATSHPELVLPMHAGTCHAPAASDAGMTTAMTAKPTSSASTAPGPHYVDTPKTDAYALPIDVSAIELDRQPGTDTIMHSIGEDFLGTSSRCPVNRCRISAGNRAAVPLIQGTAARRRLVAGHLGRRRA